MLDEYDVCAERALNFARQCKENTEEVVEFASHCIERFRTWLLDNKQEYTPIAGQEWLAKVESTLSSSLEIRTYKYTLHRMHNEYLGIPMKEYYVPPDKTIIGQLSPLLRTSLEEYVRLRKGKTSPQNLEHRLQIGACVLSIIQKYGITDVSQISYDTVLSFYSEIEEYPKYLKNRNSGWLHAFLKHLVSQNTVRESVLECAVLRSKGIPFLYKLTDKEIADIKQNSEQSEEWKYPITSIVSSQTAIIEEMRCHGYSAGSVSMFMTISKCFCIFLDYYGLPYTKKAGQVWLSYSKNTVTSITCFRERRKCLWWIEKYLCNGKIDYAQSYIGSRKTVFSKTPEWCRSTVEAYLQRSKREGLGKSALTTIRDCLSRFMIYMDSVGVTSYEQLTSELVKKFNLDDTNHRSSEGKNVFNARIRKFLLYLGEMGIVDKNLYNALPSVCARHEKIVVVLTDEERSEFEQKVKATQSEDGALSLRDKAILLLGKNLEMRRIDVVNLTLENIDWENAAIRFIQRKTRVEIEIPMPDDVADALISYLMEERPESESEHVFVSSKAPYTSLDVNTCNRTLKKAFPDRDVYGSGFHVLRKTGATERLENGQSVDEVAESLGHSDLENVRKYMSLNERVMRRCPMNLSEFEIEMDWRKVYG